MKMHQLDRCAMHTAFGLCDPMINRRYLFFQPVRELKLRYDALDLAERARMMRGRSTFLLAAIRHAQMRTCDRIRGCGLKVKADAGQADRPELREHVLRILKQLKKRGAQHIAGQAA